MLAEAGPHQKGFHGGRELARRDRSRHAGAAGDETTKIASPTNTAASCATTPTAPSTTTCGAAISPPTALYYNIADFSIWDYAGGVEDIAARRLKLIGDPVTRYREDPVRMLRAARFEAKLGFTLDGETGTRDSALARAARQRAAGAPVRRDTQAVPHGPWRKEPRGAARTRLVRRAAADGRGLPRQASRTARLRACSSRGS